MLIKVNIKEHDQYSFDGKTLIASQSITISQAILGSTVSVTLIDGSTHQIKVEPGTQDGQTVQVKTNFAVRFKLIVPDKLSE